APHLADTLQILTLLLLALDDARRPAVLTPLIQQVYPLTRAQPRDWIAVDATAAQAATEQRTAATHWRAAVGHWLLLLPAADRHALQTDLQAHDAPAGGPNAGKLWAGLAATLRHLDGQTNDAVELVTHPYQRRGIEERRRYRTLDSSAWTAWNINLDDGTLTWQPRPGLTACCADPASARLALDRLLALGGLRAQRCDEPLYQATANPRRYPLARYIARHTPHRFDLVVLDEVQEFNTVGSAQEQAAQLLAHLPRTPVLALTGSLMGGYASSLFANFRNLVPDFAREFGPEAKGRFVNRYGYWKTLKSFKDGDGDRAVQAYGTHSLRREEEQDDTIRTLGEAPGVMPSFLVDYLLPNAAVLHKTDLDYELPVKTEQPVALTLAAEDSDGHTLLTHYGKLQATLVAQIKADCFTALQGRLWGAMNELGSYLDLGTADVGNTLVSGQPAYEVCYSESAGGGRVAVAPLLPAATILPKERWLLEQVRTQLAAGRNLILFVRHTGNSRLITRYLRLLREQAGVEAIYLDSNKVDTAHREQWLRDMVIGRKRRVLIVNPEAVKTGLNCLTPYFTTAIWLETTANALTWRQANGRIHRIGSDPAQAVAIWVPVYAATAQEIALDLLARKTSASEQTDGLDLQSQLEAAGAAGSDVAAAQLAVLSMGQAIYAILEGTATRKHQYVPVSVAAAPGRQAPRLLAAPSIVRTTGPSIQLTLFDTPLPAATPTAPRSTPRPTGTTVTQLNLFDLLDAA
ncbi:MAG: hypothetical protein M3Z04_10805, partial [Chloroflexota bacterium]|nr:hypothetical protein [Chloroflexota bacterium]